MKSVFVVHPKFTGLEHELLDVLRRFEDVAEFITKGERNTIKKVEIGGHSLTVKRFKTPGFFQAIVYQFFRKSKARRSFEHASKLESLEINTPQPVAYFERFGLGLKESYYICEFLEYDFDFRMLNHNPSYPRRNKILKQVAGFTFELHEKGVHFLDHSPGNTLIIEKTDGSFDFYLIDLNRMRFGAMNFEQRMRNFRRLWLSKTMINVMSEEYARLVGLPKEKVHTAMTRYSRSFQKKINSKKLRKRRKKN